MVLWNDTSDPFDYGLPSLRERPLSEDISSISMSITIDDTFAFIHNQPRRRVDSDAGQGPCTSAILIPHLILTARAVSGSPNPPINPVARKWVL